MATIDLGTDDAIAGLANAAEVPPPAVAIARDIAVSALMGRPDAREGVEAFLARRPPQWMASPTTDWPDGVLGP